MTQADSIRAYASCQIQQARSRGLAEITIVAGEVERVLHLKNRTPNVCNSLRSLKLLRENHVELKHVEGPPSGQSTTMKFTYSLAVSGAPAVSTSSFYSLRGAGNNAYVRDGSTENYLRELREEPQKS